MDCKAVLCNTAVTIKAVVVVCRDVYKRQVSKAIYSSFSGISPLVANELAHRAGLDADSPVAAYSHDELLHLGNNFTWMMEDIKNNRFTPNIVRDGNEPKEFSSIELTQYSDCLLYTSRCV